MMSPERWRRLEELYDAAALLPPEEHERFLTEHCGADDTLRRELAEMLKNDGTVEVLREIVGRTAAAVRTGDEWTGP